MYIKPPMYLFFSMAFGLHDFEADKSITWAIVRVGPWNDNEQSECHLALVMDIARIKIITYRAIKKTGTLIVIIFVPNNA